MTTRLMTVLLAALLVASLGLSGCSTTAEEPDEMEPAEPTPLKIGTLPTEDALPLWAAEETGLFDEAGLADVEIITFQSAAERDAAFVAGEVDAYMGDIIAAAQMESQDVPVTIATIMLGTTPPQGRFGVVATPGSGYNELSALAGVPVGTSANTIQEYVLDGLMRQEGLGEEDVAKEIVDKVPVRFELLMNGQLEAASLPEPLLSFAEFQGATILRDDTVGENLSQTVLVFSDEYLATPGGVETLGRTLEVWDEAAGIVNSDPDAWRETLVEKARLPEPIKDIYVISEYPMNQVPTLEQVTAVTDWMTENGQLENPVTYEDLILVTP
jgi:NitT/TauT family transport system substrate-binding protein